MDENEKKMFLKAKEEVENEWKSFINKVFFWFKNFGISYERADKLKNKGIEIFKKGDNLLCKIINTKDSQKSLKLNLKSYELKRKGCKIYAKGCIIKLKKKALDNAKLLLKGDKNGQIIS